MADGHTFSVGPAKAGVDANRKILDAFARHGHGYSRFGGAPVPTTFVREDQAGHRFLFNAEGYLPDGTIYEVPHHGCAYRLHLIEPDCDVVLYAGEQPVRTTLRDFLANNDFDVAERVAIQVRVVAGGLYVGGGGAAAEWSLHRADVPASRFINSNGSPFFGAAA